jgi:uncharacterized protein (TIGR02246 family)
MTTDEEAIRELLAAWQRATVVNDRDALFKLMTDDVLFLTPGNAPLRGREAFAALLPPRPPHQIEFDQDVIELQIRGDWAYAVCRMAVTVTPQPEQTPIRRAGHTLTIFTKAPDGSWALARDANLLGPAQS